MKTQFTATESFGRWSRPLERRLRTRAPHGEEVILGRRRIYILPTRYGTFFAISLLVMLIGSINYNNSMGYMLTFLLGSIGIISVLYTYRNLAQLKLRAGRAQPVFAGSEAGFPILVHNPGKLARYGIALKPVKSKEPVVIDVPAENMAEAVITVTTRTRGYRPLGAVTIFTTFPLGLFRAWAYADLGMRCLVYPTPGALHKLPSSSGHDGTGESLGTHQEGSEDFFGFRNYQNGDSLHHVHWKAVARAQPMLTKQFSATESPELWLAWDMIPAPDVETRLRKLCRLVLEAHATGCRYGLRLPNKVIGLAQSETHKHHCLETLALYDAPEET